MLKRYFNRYNRIGNLTEPTCFKINTFVYSVCIYIYIYIIVLFVWTWWGTKWIGHLVVVVVVAKTIYWIMAECLWIKKNKNKKKVIISLKFVDFF